jgi:hypothetical protein
MRLAPSSQTGRAVRNFQAVEGLITQRAEERQPDADEG